jgi:hypothetical protein
VELFPHQRQALAWLLWRESQHPPGIHIVHTNKNPDPAFNLFADPDPGSQTSADPDLNQTLKSY